MSACVAKTRSGTPCRAPALRTSDRCLHHSASHAAVRRKARRAGGRARARSLARSGSGIGAPPPWWPLATVRDAACGLAFIAQEVLLGRLEARAANAAVAALNGAVAAIRGGLIEERLEVIERSFGAAGGRGD